MPDVDLNRLVRTLVVDLRVGLEGAASIAARHAHPSVEITHWLLGLLEVEGLPQEFERAGIPAAQLRRELDLSLADMARADGAQLVLSQNLLTLAREAWLVASLQYGRNRIELGDLLVALSSDQSLRIVARAVAPCLRDLDMRAVEQRLAAIETTDATPSAPGLPSGSPAGAGEDFLRL